MRLRIMAIVLSAFVVIGILPEVLFARTPDWVRICRAELGKVRSNDPVVYAKLVARAAWKYGLKYEFLQLERWVHPDNFSSERKSTIVLVQDRDGRLWCGSDGFLYRVKNEEDAFGSLWDLDDAFPRYGRGKVGGNLRNGDWEVKRRYTFPAHGK